MIYYAQKKAIKNGAPVAPSNRYGTEKEMEYQFYLFCANSVQNNEQNDISSVEWGTIEQGVIERRRWVKSAEVQPEPEEEPEENEEPVGE